MKRLVPLILLALLFFVAPTPHAQATDNPEFRPVNLQSPDADVADRLQFRDGVYTVRGYGREAHFGNDEGTFVGFKTDALNFTFAARVVSAQFTSGNAKYGLTVREGLGGYTRAFHIRYDAWEGNRCLQWFMRHHRAHDAHIGSLRAWVAGSAREFDQSEDFYLRIIRRYPYLRAYASRDGREWTDVTNYHAALLEQEVWVGMQVTAGGQGREAMTAVFDQVSFKVDQTAGDADRRATFADYKPNPRMHMHLARMTSPRGDEFSPFVIIPDGMDPKSIRALYWTIGSKEAVLYPNVHMPWENGPGRLRRPDGMKDWEGVWTYEGPGDYRGLAQQGVIRLGGAWGLAEDLDEVLAKLAELTGIEHLPHLPILPIGQSASGGAASRAASAHPHRTIAVVPTLIGPAGRNEAERAVLDVPRMIIIGSQDGGHLRSVIDAAPDFRESRALWGIAPMWTVHHRVHRTQALAIPFMMDMLEARMPPEYRGDGPPRLRRVRERQGWLGLIDTWDSNYPQVVPMRRFEGDPSRTVWLPNEHIARIWQAFCSNTPQTVIHYPRFDGHGGFSNAAPARLDWRNSHLRAGRPVEMLASGPNPADGTEVSVEFYAGLKKLVVKRQPDPENPFRVTLEPLPAGIHAIYAITTVGDEKEISRPVLVMVHEDDDD
ncbi:MAG: hypothetical protein JJU36_15890 [Phycisphaeraceae bacterium]|nr:hypothetical protein [Phycisphaeraceae bacterium]